MTRATRLSKRRDIAVRTVDAPCKSRDPCNDVRYIIKLRGPGRGNTDFFFRDQVSKMARFGVERGGGGGRFSADREISGIFTELWKLDENRLTPGKHYRINLQRG